jgi:hypothetical protein
MPEYIKGNFKPKRPVQKKHESEENLINEQFERTALKRLGGSIAFVTRKGFIWKGDDSHRKEDQECS